MHTVVRKGVVLYSGVTTELRDQIKAGLRGDRGLECLRGAHSEIGPSPL